MPDPPQPDLTLIPVPAPAKPPVPVNLPRTARRARKAAPRATAKAAKAGKARAGKKAKAAKPKPVPLPELARRLETGWEAALAAHQARVRRDFAALHRAVARAKPADAGKLRRSLERKPKASGRLKDVRRAERALKDALERLAA